jgi:hypothetical protein
MLSSGGWFNGTSFEISPVVLLVEEEAVVVEPKSDMVENREYRNTQGASKRLIFKCG